MRLLIIDDSEIDRMLIKHLIKKADPSISIIEAKNGTQGLEQIKNNEFDCVFLDYSLPCMNGVDLLKEIYDPKTELAPYPIIMITGHGRESIIIDAIKYGAQDYIIKAGLTSDILFAAIVKARHVFGLKHSQNETQEKLYHSQKIDALGKLTGGIAHDFNNLLTIILGNASLLEAMINGNESDKEKLIKKVQSIQMASQRGSDLVQHLMVFSHQRKLAPMPTNISILVEGMQNLLQRTIGKTVGIHNDLNNELWLTEIDRAQLEHVIINMAANARDAMPDGGELTISTQNSAIDKNMAAKLHIAIGEYICLKLADTGSGIKKEILSNIFDPFFTTKPIGEGTGLGMSMAYSFIKECGGTIHVQSKVGDGTIFEIYFPKSSEHNNEKTIDNENTYIENGNAQTILVVEDEEEIKDLAVSMLEQHGYKILHAPNADEALKILQDTDQKIDLLFTDIVMPGEINGVQLAGRALVLRPNIPILFTTGFIKTSIPDINLLNEYTVLNKPYKQEALLQYISKILSSK